MKKCNVMGFKFCANVDNNFVTLCFVFLTLHRLHYKVEGLHCRVDGWVAL